MKHKITKYIKPKLYMDDIMPPTQYFHMTDLFGRIDDITVNYVFTTRLDVLIILQKMKYE